MTDPKEVLMIMEKISKFDVDYLKSKSLNVNFFLNWKQYLSDKQKIQLKEILETDDKKRFDKLVDIATKESVSRWMNE